MLAAASTALRRIGARHYFCLHCGRTCGTSQRPAAEVEPGKWVCRPKTGDGPDCYRQIVTGLEPLGARAETVPCDKCMAPMGPIPPQGTHGRISAIIAARRRHQREVVHAPEVGELIRRMLWSAAIVTVIFAMVHGREWALWRYAAWFGATAAWSLLLSYLEYGYQLWRRRT